MMDVNLMTSSQNKQVKRLATSSSNNGFTLVELLSVLAIIGLLMGLLGSATSKAMRRAKISKANTATAEIVKAWRGYWSIHEQWPFTGTRDSTSATMGLIQDGEYVLFNNQGELKDPWGQYYKITLSEHVVDAKYTTGEYSIVVNFPTKNRMPLR